MSLRESSAIARPAGLRVSAAGFSGGAAEILGSSRDEADQRQAQPLGVLGRVSAPLCGLTNLTRLSASSGRSMSHRPSRPETRSASRSDTSSTSDTISARSAPEAAFRNPRPTPPGSR